jgi:protein-glutamine gamma-glutamyltransferase
MPTDFVFRLSTYLTLALSCACLGYAERAFLPEVPFIAAAVIVSLVALFRLETQIKLLAIPDANRVGLVLGLVYFGWAVVRVVRKFRESGSLDLEWQLLLIAMVGPLLMVAMPAKLARREKHVGDFWWLHGAALAAAGLSGAVAEDAVCFILIGLYATCAVWSLTLLHLRFAAGEVPTIPGHPAGVRIAGVVAGPRPRVGLAGGLGLVGLGLAIAVPMYLITPRSPAAKLEFGKARVHIGYAADQMLDLNHTGELTSDDEVAFRVFAEVNGTPHTTLSPDQRWRGRVLRRYTNGGWDRGEVSLPTVVSDLRLHPVWTGQVSETLNPLLSVLSIMPEDLSLEKWDPTPRKPLDWTPPRLAPDQVALSFTVPRELAGEFLADPVVWAAGDPVPVATSTRAGFDGWHWVGDGSFYWDHQSDPHGEPLRYLQVWHPAAQADSSPPLRIIDRNPFNRILPLTLNPVARVKEYADKLVAGMIEAGELPADCRDRINLLPRRGFHSHIARAFTNHLATSPEFQYTTNLRRDRKDLDPVEEFLFHTKAGHCERFASALVLLLRSQGIPAVMVLGFKGCEPGEEPGSYVVRQAHAHAWVDALIQAPGHSADVDVRGSVHHWVSLDPTPGGPTADQVEQSESRFGEVRSWLRGAYNEYVVNFNAEKRRRALAAIGNWLIRPEVLATLGALLAVLVLRRQLARHPTTIPQSTAEYPPHVRWFADLMVLLAAHGHCPQPGQTAREFTLAAAELLRQRSETAAVARIPIEWADAYYEARFGGGAVSPDRLADLNRQLVDLEQALTRPRNP